MSYSSSLVINQLEDIDIIGGSDFVLEFTTTDPSGVPLDLTGSTIAWRLCYYGQPENKVLEIPGVIDGTDKSLFRVFILGSTTIGLGGKFLQQPIITDTLGVVFRPAQGVVTIYPGISA